MLTFVIVTKYKLNGSVIDKNCLQYYNSGEMRGNAPIFNLHNLLEGVTGMKKARTAIAVLLVAIMLLPGHCYYESNLSGYRDIADDDPLCLPVQLLAGTHIMWGFG